MFFNQTTYSTANGSTPYTVVVADMNSDSQLDIVVADTGLNAVSVLLNAGNGIFLNQITYSTGNGSSDYSLAVGDVNSDNKLDIVVANYGLNNVGVLLNAGNATFLNQITYSTNVNSSPRALVTVDVNGDNKPDIVVVNKDSGNVGVLLNAGDGTFLSQTTYSTGVGSIPRSVAVGDVNGDNKPDIVVGNNGMDNIGVLLNAGNGTFLSQTIYSTGVGSLPRSVAIVDVNNDSKPDIVVANNGFNSVGVLFNTGNGTFLNQITYSTGNGSSLRQAAVGDVNGDSLPDIVVANQGTNNVGVLLNAGNGTFLNQTTYSTGNGSTSVSVAIADVNGDNKPDIVVANEGTNNVGVLFNTGNGTFLNQITYSTGNGSTPFAPVVADVNSDGKPDIVVADAGSNAVGILLNAGNGTFLNQTTYSTGNGASEYSVAVADVNSDNNPDIVVANFGLNDIGVLLNAGNGIFLNQTTYSTLTASSPRSVAVVDVNSDSLTDIVVANEGSSNVGVLLNGGNGTFLSISAYSTGVSSSPRSVAVVDVNGDNRSDIVVANQASNNVGVLFNAGNGTFLGQVTYSTGASSSPHSVAVADMNRDSLPDIVVGNTGSNNVGVLFNAGNGTFLNQTTYSTNVNSSPRALVTVDVNGDNKPDIVVVNKDSGNVGVLLNAGDGTFLSQTTYSTGVGSMPRSVAVGDVNGDNKPDIVVGNNGMDNIGVLLNAGDGTFLSQTTYSTGVGSLPRSVAIVDVNNDSKPDIVVANNGFNSVGVLFNGGNGTFLNQITYSTGNGSSPRQAAVGDVNGDSLPDIVVANQGTNNVGVLLNAGNGTFLNQTTYSTGNGSTSVSVAIADVNGDNKPDIVVANEGTNNVGVLFNTGNGTFLNQITYSTGNGSTPFAPVVADVNSDGKPDIVVADAGSNAVGILLNAGNGTFLNQTTYSTGNGASEYSVAVADVNSDNKPDIVVANFGLNDVGVLLNTGNGIFLNQTTYSTLTASSPRSVAVADVNSDSLPDIVVANEGLNNIGVLLNAGNGAFLSQTTYSTGSGSTPFWVAVADVNSDNKLDIVVANEGSDNVGVLLHC